jgi:hypothetical protein
MFCDDRPQRIGYSRVNYVCRYRQAPGLSATLTPDDVFLQIGDQRRQWTVAPANRFPRLQTRTLL